jgi:hypothetical protein
MWFLTEYIDNGKKIAGPTIKAISWANARFKAYRLDRRLKVIGIFYGEEEA